MIDFELEIEEQALRGELDELEIEVTYLLLLAMEQVGVETNAFLRSLTSETRPPAKPGEPSRRAHPGGWADVSSNLANSYRFELWSGGHRVVWSTEGQEPVVNGQVPRRPSWPLRLDFLAGMEYAAHLEARDGYWVISGVTEAGGPVRRAMQTILMRVAPDVKVRVVE